MRETAGSPECEAGSSTVLAFPEPGLRRLRGIRLGCLGFERRVGWAVRSAGHSLSGRTGPGAAPLAMTSRTVESSESRIPIMRRPSTR